MVAGTSRSTPARSLTLALAGIALALALCTVIEVVLLVSGPVEPAWVIVLFPMLAWMYIAAGLVAWRRRPRNRVGAILVTGGIAWLAAGLVNTGVPPLIVVGQVRDRRAGGPHGGGGVDEGTGLRGLGDRLDALGGRLSVDSPTGGGRTLTAVVPCAS